MKQVLTILLLGSLCLAVLAACAPATPTTAANAPSLQQQVKDLQDLAPGLGEFMVSFQLHFAKVWFAGENGNWPLAKFETGEIVEGMDGAKAARPAAAGMLDAFTTTSLTPLEKAIEAKDKAAFETAYKSAVEGCNSCHSLYTSDAKWPQGRPFIKITVPSQPPVFNQQWEP